MNKQRIPSLALAALLSLAPVARVANLSPALSSATYVIVSRCLLGIAAALGTVDAVSGASAFVAGVQSLLPAASGIKTNITGKVGSPMVLRIILSGSVGLQPQLDYYNASPLPPGLTINTNVNTNSSGLESTNYYIYGTPTVAGVYYPVKITAGNLLYPTTTSTNILITITNASGGGGTAPTITTQPQDLSVNSGAAATFSVVATGSPTPTYQWRKDGVILNGATGTAYHLAAASPADGGGYSVIVSNASGSVTSRVATLTVTVPPAFTKEPQDLTASVGGTASFLVVVTGTPTPILQWLKNGSPIAGATSTSFSLPTVAAADAGGYSVVASNSSGSVTSRVATLAVVASPLFATEPQDLTITLGSAATFTASATGTPTPTLQWLKDGKIIAGATATSLSITAATVSDAGAYSVIASNSSGSITSRVATLTVIVPPSIARQPQDITVTNGSAASFQVTVSGSPAPLLQWFKGSGLVVGATNPELSFITTTTNDAGTYFVIVTNAGGAVTSQVATLTVLVPPSILTQPKGVSVAKGSSATFTVEATGIPAPTYQWQWNGTPLLGATNPTLQIANVQTTNVGTYTVEVRNAAGVLLSSPAELALTTVSGPITLTQFQFNGGVPQFVIEGPNAATVIVATSADLVLWTPLTTNVLVNGTATVIDSGIAAATPARFYRATLQP